MTSERRTTHRLNIELPAFVGIPGSPKNISLASTLNISATGVCLLSKHRFDVGQELLLKVNLPIKEKLTINVRVVWFKEIITFNGREYMSGIKIIDAMRFDEAKLVRFYAEQLIEFFKSKRDESKYFYKNE